MPKYQRKGPVLLSDSFATFHGNQFDLIKCYFLCVNFLTLDPITVEIWLNDKK